MSVYKWELEVQSGEVICPGSLGRQYGWDQTHPLGQPTWALLWSSVHKSAHSARAGRESQTPMEPGNDCLAASQPRPD